MKKIILTLAIAVCSPPALASNDTKSAWQDKYHTYVQTIGDATPVGMHEWGVANGYLPDTSMKERIKLSAKDQAYIMREMNFGDATMLTASTVSVLKERVKITPLERDYIDFTSTYGDGTPPQVLMIGWRLESLT